MESKINAFIVVISTWVALIFLHLLGMKFSDPQVAVNFMMLFYIACLLEKK